jgi:pyruvate dehydrogenase E2 component (dihydrolipoamide acetyltransferase)
MPEAAMSTMEIKVPDIGDFKDVPIIQVFVKPGDTVKPEDPLITLESDKATMDVPSPAAGTVKDLRVKVGDKVSEGKTILVLDAPTTGDGKRAAAPSAAPTGGNGKAAVAAPSAAPAPSPPAAKPAPPAPVEPPPAPPAPLEQAPAREPAPAAEPAPPAAEAQAPIDSAAFKRAHASPSVRRFARDLGVDLTRVTGTGPKGRILQSDVQSYVKRLMSGEGAPGVGAQAGIGALNILPWPKVDFAKFGPVEVKPLPRIKKISGANLARNWVMIPHVTQFDEADITDLEALRLQLNKENEKTGIKVTLLAFVMKACVAALRKIPELNSSLDGDNLVLKQYFHIGFAADTPNGLVVPVVRDCDKKGVLQIAQETAALAAKAREGKLSPSEMQGASFSISSLGGIGGTAFTPIINAPEVAILGVSKSVHRPVWDGKQFLPRLILPLSLSYDHRVVDGATAARFTAYLVTLLADMRRAML